MATYNWSYKFGIDNKYGIIINDSGTDDVRPSNAAYVALFGNDVTGNGSRQYPYRTITQGSNVGQYVIVASGVYRESSIGQGHIVGDGDVIFDGFLYANFNPSSIRNIQMRNMQQSFRIDIIQDCRIEGDGIVSEDMYQNSTPPNHNIYKNLGSITLRQGGPLNSTIGYNTWVNIPNLHVQVAAYNGIGANAYGTMWFGIYENCNISFEGGDVNVDYCIFHNCSFRIDSGAYTPINDLPTLIAFIQTAYPGNQSFQKSLVTDPLFNNPAIGDYTLQLNSPAKNLSYFGTPIGATSIAYGLKAASDSTSAFETDSAVNVTVTSDSITLTDPTQEASIITKVLVNSLGREIDSFPIFGFNADRNGQYIDSIADLAVSSIAAGAALHPITPYLVGMGQLFIKGILMNLVKGSQH